MRRVLVGVLALGLTAASLAGCAKGAARERARQDLIDQLVDGGLDRTLADCVVEGFFAERTDDELQAFIARPELTGAERAEFARLGESCQSV